jgi:hypothetical protein
VRFIGLVVWFALTLSVGRGADQQIKTGCFVGPSFIQGVAKDACVVPSDGARVMEAPVVDDRGRSLVLLERPWGAAQGDSFVGAQSRNCSDYLRTHRGMPVDTPEMHAIGAVYRRACLTAKTLVDAGAGPGALVRSHVARDGSDVADLRSMPAAVLELPLIDDLREGGPPLAAEVQSGRLKILDPQIGQFKVRWRNHTYVLIVTGRADVNGDGFEDVIVMVASQTLQGKERGIRFAFLTRTTPHGPLIVAKPVSNPMVDL